MIICVYLCVNVGMCVFVYVCVCVDVYVCVCKSMCICVQAITQENITSKKEAHFQKDCVTT